jgi:hypothetical protein
MAVMSRDRGHRREDHPAKEDETLRMMRSAANLESENPRWTITYGIY